MTSSSTMSVRTLAWTVLAIQLGLIVVMGLVWWLLASPFAAYSALIGGGIYWVPQLLYSLIGSSHHADDLNAGLVLWDIYCGAGAKLLATLVLFGVTFRFLEVQHVPMFVTYGLALCLQWVISLTLNNRY